MPDRLPKVLMVLPGFIPSTLIDVVKPLLALEQLGKIQLRTALEIAVSRPTLAWPDLVVFCRNCEWKRASALEAALERRVPYIYDIDDNLFEIPPDTALGRYHLAPERLAMLSQYIQHADLVRVYSRPMEERALTLTPRIEQVVAPVDWSLVRHPERASGNKVRIIYTTSRDEDPLANLVVPGMQRILAEYPGKVELHFWGHFPTAFRNLNGVRHWRAISNYDEFMRRFSQAGFDIGLAPLLDNVFYRSKTNNKFREYAACRIAGIYTDVDVYSDCVVDGETGLLAERDPEGWYGAIKRLVENDALRHKIQDQAEAYARQHYTQDNFIAVWEAQIQKVLVYPRQDERIIFVSPQDLPGRDALPRHHTDSLLGRLIHRIGLLLHGTPQAAAEYFSHQVYSWWQLFKINWFRKM